MKQSNNARQALEQRIAPLRNWPDTRPPKGWLRAIRDALGMTAGQFAARLGVSQPRISALEKSEVEGTVTLATLRRAAEALDCRLIYAIVPNRSLEEMVRARATRLADEQLDRVSHTMRLEKQLLSSFDREKEHDRLVASYLQGDLRRLWEQP